MLQLWNDLRDKLGLVDADQPDDETLVEFATAALLLDLCQSDLDVDPREVEMVRKALSAAFGLDDSDIEPLVRKAFEEAEEKVSFHPEVEIVNEHCSPEEKARIVRQAWRVAFADGRLDKYEEHYIRRLCDLIHVPHRVFLQMRHRVEEEGRKRSGD